MAYHIQAVGTVDSHGYGSQEIATINVMLMDRACPLM